MGSASAIFELPAYPLRFDYLPASLVVALFVLLALPVVWLGRSTIAWQGATRGWTVIGVRLAGVWVLVLLLAGARWERQNKDLEVIFLRDVSVSTAAVPHPDGTTLTDLENDYLKALAERKPPRDRIGVVRFDDRAAIEALPGTRLRGGSLDVRAHDGGGTDVAGAIQLGLAGFTGDSMRRLVLASDGNATQGETDAAVSAAIAASVTIDVMPLTYRIEGEVMVERLIAPAYKREGATFTLEAILRSTHSRPINALLTVSDGGRPIDLDPDAPGLQPHLSVNMQPGMTAVRVKAPPGIAGVHQFAARLEGIAGADTLAGNNVAEAITFVRGRMRVLYVDGVGGEAGCLLRDALLAEKIAIDDADHIPPDRFPAHVKDLHSYDAVVMANVGRGVGGLDARQERALVQYVRDLGGGVVVIGGRNALGAGGWSDTEFESILPVKMQPRDRRIVPPGALMIVLDRSGSMTDPLGRGGAGTKQKAANAAATAALWTLRTSDYVGVIAFDQSPACIVPLAANEQPARAAERIRDLKPGGGTSIYPALEAAYEALFLAAPAEVRLRHILLMTDGVSASGEYDRLLAKMSAAGITLSTVAVGSDADSQLLNRLAQRGGGVHCGVNDAQELTDVFVREAQSIARPIIHEPPQGILPLGDGLTLPKLAGMVLTTPRSGAQVLARSASDGDVVLARGNAGLGRAVVFTGDATPRWGEQWIRSEMFGRFWADTIRSVARPPMDDSIQITTVRDGPQAQLIVEATDRGGRAANFLTITGKLTTPDTARAAEEVKLAQTGPGRYETTLQTRDAGVYLAALNVQRPTGEAGRLWVGMSVSSSQELRDLTSNEALLTEIASRTGGRILPPLDPVADVFSREGLRKSVSSHPIHDLLIQALLAIILIDVSVRRIAWDWPVMKQLMARGMEQAQSFFTMRPVQSAAMLATLRQVRRDVVRHKTHPAAIDLPPVTAAAACEASPAAPSSPYAGNLWEAKRRARMIIREQEKN